MRRKEQCYFMKSFPDPLRALALFQPVVSLHVLLQLYKKHGTKVLCLASLSHSLLFSTSERLLMSLTSYSSFFSTAPSQPQRWNFPSCPRGCCPLCRWTGWTVLMFSTSCTGETSQDVLTRCPLGSAALQFDKQGM